MNTETIKEILKEKGVRPSLHRMKILEYLVEKKNHPTVDTIYNDIIDDIPTLSRTTIYNTLKTFTENNVVQTIMIEGTEVRYDADTSSHGHFKCTECGKVYDLFINPDVFDMKKISGHKIEEQHLYFRGICKECQ